MRGQGYFLVLQISGTRICKRIWKLGCACAFWPGVSQLVREIWG